MVFRQVGNDTDKLINKFGILNKSFANIKMDFQNGQGIRSLSNIVSKQDVANFEKFQQDLKDGVSYHKAFNNNLAQSHTYVQQQAVRLRELNVQQKLLNRQLTTGKITQAEYKTAMSANQAQVKSLTTQTKNLTFAQKASAIASKVMGTALKTALNIGLMLAINGIISKITEQVNKQEELIESAKQSAQETKEYIDSLDGLKEKYLEIVDSESSMSEKTQELNKFKQELVETYGFEKDIIDKLNLSREYGIELLDKELQKEAQAKRNEYYTQNDEAIKKAIKNVENVRDLTFGGGDNNLVFNESDVKKLPSYIQDVLDVQEEKVNTLDGLKTFTNIKFKADDIFEEYDIVNSIATQLQAKRDAGIQELNVQEEEFLEFLEEYSKELKEKIDDYGNTYQTYYEYKSQDLLEDYVNKYGDAANLTGRELENWKNGLYETANGNAVLEKSLESLIDKVYQFNDAETELSLSGTGISENLSESLQTALSEYEDKISDFLSEKDKIDSALKEQIENGSISESTAIDLVGSGYTSGVKYNSATQSYSLDDNTIKAIYKTRSGSIVETLKTEQESISEIISNLKTQYEEIEKKQSNISNIRAGEYFQNQKEAIAENLEVLEDLSDSYGIYISSLENVSTSTDNASDSISNITDKISQYSDELDKLDSVKSVLSTAQQEQEENGRLTASTIKALAEAGYANALSYNELTGETTLLTDSINALTKAQIANQKVDLLKTLSETKSKLEDINEEYNELYSKEMSNYKVQRLTQLYEEKGDYEEAIAELEKELMMLDAYVPELQIGVSIEESAEETVEDYIDSIKEAFDNEKSELDHLLNMDVISQEEYYNRLFDLNEKYFKGKTELLDEYRQYEEEVYKGLKQVQIDALQEQIDALKSVNEEKQEEIDLEKAKQALENAKRQKTISVYDSERGWIRETDRNAIDSAQKEYDDLVLNEQVETLENLIDAIENGANTSHQLDESINAVEQANSITGQQFIENVMQSFANKGLDFNSMFNTNGLTNGADVYNSIMQGKITPVSSDSYTTNNNNTITLNGVTVMANNPEEFIAQMEDIANERFKENFPSAMNQFGRDLQRYKMNHSL